MGAGFVIALISGIAKKQLHFLVDWFLVIGFIISVLGTVGSLFLSFVMKLPPCDLCWYQRIFLFPQVILWFVAWRYNDRLATKYLLPMSIAGGIIALYHIGIQEFPASTPHLIPCSISGPSCGEKFINEFGYITIPVMSLTVFLYLSLISFLGNIKKRV